MSCYHKALPSTEDLWRRFDYEPFTGNLLWKMPSKYKPFLKGKPAGYASETYIWIRLAPEPGPYVAHRLVWRWVTGEDPGNDEIDHINLNKQDNRFHNLRRVTQFQQKQNMAKRSIWGKRPTKSKLKGVYFNTQANGHVTIFSRIRANDQKIHLGVFASEQLAHEAYCKASHKYHGKFGRFQ